MEKEKVFPPHAPPCPPRRVHLTKVVIPSGTQAELDEILDRWGTRHGYDQEDLAGGRLDSECEDRE